MVSLGAGRRVGAVDRVEVRGPAAHPLWGHLLPLRRDPLGFFTACARDYGDVVPLRFINVRTLLLNHPRYVEAVLVGNHDAFEKPPVFRRNRSIMGDGLLVTDGEGWHRQRRVAQPAFDRSHLIAYAPAFVDIAARAVAGWQDGATYDVHREMTRITVIAVAATLFGTDVESEADRLVDGVGKIATAMTARLNTYYAFPERLPTPANRLLQRGVRELEEVVTRLIANRRASGEERDDLLTYYLRVHGADGSWMTDRLLRDEVMTFLLAGHESTSIVLTWAWYLLAQYPEVEAALHAELDEVLGGRLPEFADRSKLPYTEAVFQEALRLYPPIWSFARIATRTVEVDGIWVPKRWRVAVSPWVIHRDPRFFAGPDRFDPARWLDERARQVPRYAYFPFSVGPRACIGAGFSMLEGVLLLATIAQQVRFVPRPDHPVAPLPAVTLRPRNGIMATLFRR
jgi:cytochrome P450